MEKCCCRRCGHTWKPKQSNPAKCPSCKSLNWNKDKEGQNLCRRHGYPLIYRSKFGNSYQSKCVMCLEEELVEGRKYRDKKISPPRNKE